MIFPIHKDMFADVVLMELLFRQPHWCDFMGTASLAHLEDTISQNAPWSPDF